MNLALRRSPVASAFTLIELIVVIVVLAVLSAVAVPKYIDYSANAKSATCKGVLGNVRTAIANFYANSAVSGTAAYPTLAQMQANGTVLQDIVPANPFNGSATIAAATWAATPPVSGAHGWNYDAATGRFWANSSGSGENTW